MIASYTAVADATELPVIMYNVPSRTGVNIAPDTAYALSAHPKINAIKEASGNISQVAQIAALCGDDLNIYSGNDDQIDPAARPGRQGRSVRGPPMSPRSRSTTSASSGLTASRRICRAAAAAVGIMQCAVL